MENPFRAADKHGSTPIRTLFSIGVHRRSPAAHSLSANCVPAAVCSRAVCRSPLFTQADREPSCTRGRTVLFRTRLMPVLSPGRGQAVPRHFALSTIEPSYRVFATTRFATLCREPPDLFRAHRLTLKLWHSIRRKANPVPVNPRYGGNEPLSMCCERQWISSCNRNSGWNGG